MIESVQKQLESHLDTLEVDSTYTWADIEKQYRQLIQRWHPDRNLGESSAAAQSRFIEINVAYKAIRDQYRKNGSIPRHMPPEQQGPLLGTKKEVVIKPALYKNKLVVALAASIALLSVVGLVLWSLESRLAENNRERAKVEKTNSSVEEAAIAVRERLKSKANSKPITQSATDIEP